MNAPATTSSAKVPVVAGGNVRALVPQSLEEAFRVASAIAASGMAPKGIDKPEQIMVAIMAGAELGLAPFQALQSIAVVNGRPCLWGDGLMAVARRNGIKAREWMDGQDDARVAHCLVTRPDTGEEIERTFSVTDAKKAGLWGKQGPWQQYPQRMLQMRARAWALRDGCADMLRGFQVREEVEDFQHVRDVTPQATGMRARLEARQSVGGFDPAGVSSEIDHAIEAEFVARPAEDGAHDPDTGEIIEAELEAIDDAADEDDFPGDRTSSPPAFDPVQWAADAHRKALTFEHEPALKKWWNSDETKRDRDKLQAANPGLYDTLLGQVRAHGTSLSGGI